MSKPTDRDIVTRWKAEVCLRSKEVDPCFEFTWEGVWCGFVIGAGRKDLANYNDYMRLGFPEEMVLGDDTADE